MHYPYADVRSPTCAFRCLQEGGAATTRAGLIFVHEVKEWDAVNVKGLFFVVHRRKHSRASRRRQARS